jgi:hypothetical protein
MRLSPVHRNAAKRLEEAMEKPMGVEIFCDQEPHGTRRDCQQQHAIEQTRMIRSEEDAALGGDVLKSVDAHIKEAKHQMTKHEARAAKEHASGCWVHRDLHIIRI